KELQMSEEIMNIGSAEGDQILELDINRLRAFKNHPFKVTADMSMVELKDSIEKYGILNPLIVRPVPEGYYEIISGHRNQHIIPSVSDQRNIRLI
ncbi:ParB N-terminal domain-containing protein, partial [Blautia obeum]|uniref:ParB N-terminal domain-containing protein n=1 Tax=Blautia obeum TaxID=40520 RepID=UPI003D0308DE